MNLCPTWFVQKSAACASALQVKPSLGTRRSSRRISKHTIDRYLSILPVPGHPGLLREYGASPLRWLCCESGATIYTSITRIVADVQGLTCTTRRQPYASTLASPLRAERLVPLQRQTNDLDRRRVSASVSISSWDPLQPSTPCECDPRDPQLFKSVTLPSALATSPDVLVTACS